MSYITPSPVSRMDLASFMEHAREYSLPAALRMMLVADGSLTQLLRGCSLEDVRVETVWLDDRPADALTAQCLGIPESIMTFHREVWLKAGKERLVFASSDWHFAEASAHSEVGEERRAQDKSTSELIDEFKQNELPVGDFIRQKGLWSKQEDLEIGWYDSPELTRAWKGRKFWGRRYRLLVGRGIRASILEIFSPRLGEMV